MKSQSQSQISLRSIPLLLIAAALTLHGPQAFSYGIGFKTPPDNSGKPGKVLGHPVHQVLTDLAVKNSGLLEQRYPLNNRFSQDSTLALRERDLNQILEGVVFNDDPDGYSMANTAAFKTGHPKVRFALTFINYNGDPEETSATEQSHFGDFQFMHAMGSATSDPSTTDTREMIRNRILTFMGHVWKINTTPDSLAAFNKQYQILKPKTEMAKKLQAAGKISDATDAQALKEQFQLSDSDMVLWPSIVRFNRKILTFHSKNQMEFQNRALGSMLHIIQDSYAKGHTVREGWEKDNSGPIRFFQDYAHQNSSAHDKHDKHDGEEVSQTNYVEIPGATKAEIQSSKLLTMLKNKCPWTLKQGRTRPTHSACSQTVEDFLMNDVFAFSNNSPADQMTRSAKALESLVMPDLYN